MTLALLCQFTAQHVSDVNTSIFRSLRLLGALLVRITAQYSLHNNAPSSHKLLKMNVLTSETC